MGYRRFGRSLTLNALPNLLFFYLPFHLCNHLFCFFFFFFFCRFEEKISEMECVALKTSISKKEMAFKLSPQVLSDDLWTVNLQNGSSCDDFIVDELLDFSNEPAGGEEEDDDEEEDKPCTVTVFVSPEKQTHEEHDKISDHTSEFSSKYDFGSVPASELGVPADDLVSLEWLSHFVEDSNSEYSTPFPARISAKKPKEEKPENLVLIEPCFKTSVPAKARSKRTRTAVRVWPLGSPSLTESSSSSTSSSSSSSNPSSPYFVFAGSVSGMKHELTEQSVVCFQKPLMKKMKKRPAGEAASGGGGGGSQPLRRCSHCGVQKTPQWRTGPLGAKTLCNACGVRYKSGRILPEYRPACSPTFSSDLHSNHHRKVIEMRRKKESSGQAEPDMGPPSVPSF